MPKQKHYLDSLVPPAVISLLVHKIDVSLFLAISQCLFFKNTYFPSSKIKIFINTVKSYIFGQMWQFTKTFVPPWGNSVGSRGAAGVALVKRGWGSPKLDIPSSSQFQMAPTDPPQGTAEPWSQDGGTSGKHI